MTDGLLVVLPRKIHEEIWSHLLPQSHTDPDEEAAFLFVREVGESVLEHVEWMRVDRRGFKYQSSGYLELADEMRGVVIKRAHDLGACIVELHSHPYPWARAQFSPTDLSGLAEFVPHARWRLKAKPYVAIVVGPHDFDGLAWQGSATEPEGISGLSIDGRAFQPTGLTLAGARPKVMS